MDNKSGVQEEIVIKRQWIAVIAAFVLFAVGGFLSQRMFGDTRYGVLGVCIPMLYLGISSIKNRVSIIRLRGKKEYSRDSRAVTLGTFMIILAILYVVFALFPF
jgi:hypothetical protein